MGTNKEPLILYVDAETYNNGRRGYQQTSVVVCGEDGHVLFIFKIGDFTNNEGEILAILGALKKVYPGQKKHIFTDSKIAFGWATKERIARNVRKLERKNGPKYMSRLNKILFEVKKLMEESESTLEWIPRERNLAGIYFEQQQELMKSVIDNVF